MTVTDYTYLLTHPDAISDRRTRELESVVEEFPYFQSARALRLKGLYNQNSFQYNQALRITAAHTTERSVLFDFITSDTFTGIHKGLYDRKLAELHGIDVEHAEILGNPTPIKDEDKLEQSILSSIREAEAARQEVVFEEVVPESQLFAVIDQAEEEATTTLTEVETVESATSTSEDSSTTIKSPEEKLGIGLPLTFNKEEKHSFFEWLQLSRLQPIDRSETTDLNDAVNEASASHDDANGGEEKNNEVATVEMPEEKSQKIALIDKFIETNPRIPPVRQDLKPTPLPEPAVDAAALMTETLARVYLEQKKYTKAIQAYEILILKYPEKSSFFADRISEIKNLQQNNLIQ